MQDAYATAGVDIAAGNKAVELMQGAVNATQNANVLAGLGGFGSLFKLPTGYQQPVLISGADGVGSKLLLAIAANQHATIGQDLVAMVANDILAQGAKPLFMLDYMGINTVEPAKVAEIVTGIAQACQAAQMALIGGETAELPDLYAKNHYDLAGFAVGIADQAKLLNPDNVQAGDVILGLASSGLHSNGYSLVRKLLLTDQAKQWADLSMPDQATLLTPTKLYIQTVLPLIEQGLVVAAAHITGGGLLENLPRALGANLGAQLDSQSWQIPAIFKRLGQLGDLSTTEMLRTFNLGIGFTLIVRPADVAAVMAHLSTHGETVSVLGQVVPDDTHQVTMQGALNYAN
ncbi:phosphoribosylformylglycinamidine cyclo-ligase [Periweissella fabalis]|uniref:Phosphoribosylformylglycinamidine cyclo-ligase n=1 Tax=Periweissella fabalis TaxID=1070421 RepID=A0A7X6N649_9LACO|nr:phosphoribosylformylglycinamidine cyclo-ligase [Periweissella fabalis]MCM0598176.1 phosphoribosylformylglycinamidine cyclo-ligase [Periweissella fabalis]NKZ24700.1 phosphoribosylformylglycinamidine cyclo-ligase [Periweissella fabalis]